MINQTIKTYWRCFSDKSPDRLRGRTHLTRWDRRNDLAISRPTITENAYSSIARDFTAIDPQTR